MRIVLVCPMPRGSRLGNRITAVRWREILAALGHSARVTVGHVQGACDVVVALHARKSASAVRRSREEHPERRVVLALTGTDLYRDLQTSDEARRSLVLADRIVVLHERAVDAVPRRHRSKTRVIRQSATAARAHPRRRADVFDVALVAHLRPEKDPLRAALAARLLPPTSRVRILHAGRALQPELAREARREQSTNARYEWLGEVAPARAMGIIGASRLLVLTSVMEGGANVLGEAIVSGVPIVSSRIPAAVSALGADYEGFFRVGDTRALARLLARVEGDPSFLRRLTAQTRARRHLFAPSIERAAWRSLLRELRGSRSA